MSDGERRAAEMGRVLLGVMLAVFGWMTPAAAQTLIVVDDIYGVPQGDTLLVEAPGVLDNDTYNGEPAEDGGAVIDLPVTVDVSYGTLILNSDGSFSYSPGLDFPGTDSFTYQASVGMETSQAVVTISACDTGPTVFTCWMEAPYLAKLAELAIGTIQEGFEDDAAWGPTRSPSTAPSVISLGIEWKTNHPDPPASNEIMTGGGPARTGLWGVFDPDHGYATGTSEECDINNPPTHCLYKDGLTGVRQVRENTLYGVGGYFDGTANPNLVMILDGGAPIGLGNVPSGHQFYGVIDTGGFTTFRFEDIDGKIGQARYVFADDFTFGITSTTIFADGFETGDVSMWSAVEPPLP